MKTSTERILTTHTGSLPRPDDLVQMMFDKELGQAQPADAFMTAASPGVIAHFLENRYYGSTEAYLAALADAMRPEYEAIAAAGFVLQLDCPDLAMSRHTGANRGTTTEQFRAT